MSFAFCHAFHHVVIRPIHFAHMTQLQNTFAVCFCRCTPHGQQCNPCLLPTCASCLAMLLNFVVVEPVAKQGETATPTEPDTSTGRSRQAATQMHTSADRKVETHMHAETARQAQVHRQAATDRKTQLDRQRSTGTDPQIRTETWRQTLRPTRTYTPNRRSRTSVGTGMCRLKSEPNLQQSWSQF